MPPLVGRVSVLIATDIVSRGLDIKNVRYVSHLQMMSILLLAPEPAPELVSKPVTSVGGLGLGLGHEYLQKERDISKEFSF